MEDVHYTTFRQLEDSIFGQANMHLVETRQTIDIQSRDVVDRDNPKCFERAALGKLVLNERHRYRLGRPIHVSVRKSSPPSNRGLLCDLGPRSDRTMFDVANTQF